jgi:hypothetical protein
MSLRFARAASAHDYESLRRLNHRIFAEEIGQHEATADGLLVDRFEAQSAYYLAWSDSEAVGMVSVHGDAPFSVEQRFPAGLDIASIPGRKLEVRLLAILPAFRNGMVLAGLLGPLTVDAIEAGYEVVFVSGLSERVELYRSLGFRELGPPVPSGQALYVPMMLRLDELPGHIRAGLARWRRRTGR